MSERSGAVTLAPMRRPPRNDLYLALGLAALCLLQVTVAYPIASTPVGVLVALAIPLPLAWRRIHPVAVAIATSAAWLIPTDGYLFLGYLVAFIAFYSLAAHVGPARTVLPIAAPALNWSSLLKRLYQRCSTKALPAVSTFGRLLPRQASSGRTTPAQSPWRLV